METDHFEWDDSKARVNLDKDRVSFEDATFVFDDPDAIDYPDETEDYGEERWIIVGRGENELLLAVYTMRGRKTRILCPEARSR